MKRLFQETIAVGLQVGTLQEEELRHVTVDTSVQEKAIHFPTDIRLCDRVGSELVK